MSRIKTILRTIKASLTPQRTDIAWQKRELEKNFKQQGFSNSEAKRLAFEHFRK